MKHYITFEKQELSSTITTLGYNLHQVAEGVTYFKEYAKIKGVEHDSVNDRVIENINKCLIILNDSFNLPKENNSCLLLINDSNMKDTVERAVKNHYNPYSITIPKLQELIKSFLAISEREGKDTNWDAIKNQCKSMLK